LDEIDSRTRVTRFRPYLDLTLEDPLYKVGVGYNLREEETKTRGFPALTLVNEEYYNVLGWRPEGLPSIDMQIRRTKTFDKEELVRDVTEDYYNLRSRYRYQGLQLYYDGTLINTKEDLINLDIQQQLHNGRINYANTFFDRRILLNTTYEILHRETKTRSKERGTVDSQIFPFAGLSAIDDTPADNPLLPNPALIDGDLVASSGINIGLPPLGGDIRPRNVGLDFLNVTEVNKLFVWVDIKLSSTIASSFSWQIWISSDNLNWTLFTTIFPAAFATFQNRFELTFPNVSTRYIKVVTDPLSPAVPGAGGFPNILISEIQAFIQRPVEDLEDKVRSTSHTYHLDGKARLLNTPSLFYELYFFYNQLEPQSQRRYNLSNGFSVNHRFNPVLSATARVAVEDGEERDEKRLAYIGNASITADPLRTLRHSLVFYGRDEEIEGRPNNSYSLILYNNAQLYQGIDVNLSGGVNYAQQETGERRTDYLINLGANLIPHRTLTLGLNVSDTISRFRGGERASGTSDTRRYDFNINFNPLRTIYFFALIQVIDEKDEDVETTQNYGINWSPFPDGTLQFNFTYNENLRTEDKEKERIFTPSVRWNITRRSYLEVSYQIIRSESDLQKIDSKVLGTNLKIFF
jgi:hypothetical protein